MTTALQTAQAEARLKTGPVFLSHSAIKADGTVDWFIVKNPSGGAPAFEAVRLADAGRAVVQVAPAGLGVVATVIS